MPSRRMVRRANLRTATDRLFAEKARLEERVATLGRDLAAARQEVATLQATVARTAPSKPRKR